MKRRLGWLVQNVESIYGSIQEVTGDNCSLVQMNHKTSLIKGETPPPSKIEEVCANITMLSPRQNKKLVLKSFWDES